MSQFKDAYEAGRKAVSHNRKSQLFTAGLTAVGAAMIGIFAPYLGASTLREVVALLAWLFLAVVLGYWVSRRSFR